MKPQWILATATAALFAAPTLLQAAEEPGNPPARGQRGGPQGERPRGPGADPVRPLAGLAQKLNLDEEQTTKFHEIVRRNAESLRNDPDIQAARQAVEDARQAQDREAARTAMEALAKVQKDKTDALVDAIIVELKPILTAEQANLLDTEATAIKARTASNPGARGQGGPGGPNAPGGPGAMRDPILENAEQLKLTEEQIIQIKAINDEMRTHIEALRDATPEQRRETMRSFHDKRMGVLNDEQRTQLREMRATMARERGPRADRDGQPPEGRGPRGEGPRPEGDRRERRPRGERPAQPPQD